LLATQGKDVRDRLLKDIKKAAEEQGLDQDRFTRHDQRFGRFSTSGTRKRRKVVSRAALRHIAFIV
jgi:hypothetical protein